MTREKAHGGAAGFSLAELLVAMVITMMVTGAIYGLMASGQGAFRIQPERTDLQQNLRIALDLIMRDVTAAGAGMPEFVQTFTPGLDACVTCPDGGAPMGTAGLATDELEILANSSGYSTEDTCGNPGGSQVVRLMRGTTNIPPSIPVVIFMDDGTWTVRYTTGVANPNSGEGNCVANRDHVQLDFNAGAKDTTGMNPAGTICQPSNLGQGTTTCGPGGGGPGCCRPVSVGLMEVVRYRIRYRDPDTNAIDPAGVPVLERSSNGQPFETVATGIDDLQVQYLQAAPGSVPVDNAPTVETCNANCTSTTAYDSLIVQARVVVSARSEAQNVQGALEVASGPARIRSQLISQVSPRAALETVSRKSILITSEPSVWQ